MSELQGLGMARPAPSRVVTPVIGRREASGQVVPASPNCERQGPVQGQWSACAPEATWVREVLAHSGMSVAGDTGSALIASTGTVKFYIWAYPAEPRPHGESLSDAVAQGEVTPLYQVESVDRVTVYGGTPDMAWQAQGLEVWLERGGIIYDLPDSSTVKAIVHATLNVPYPG